MTEYGIVDIPEKGGQPTIPAYQTEKLTFSDLCGYEVSLKQKFHIGDSGEMSFDFGYPNPTPQDPHYIIICPAKLYQFVKSVEKGMNIDSIKEQFPDWSIEQLENRKVNTI